MTSRPQRVTIGTEEPTTVDPAAPPAGAPGEGAPREDAGSAIHVGAVGRPDRDGRRRVEVVVDGWRYEAIVEDAARADLRDRARRERAGAAVSGGPLEIRAIIPGRVVAVRVTVDDVVEAGQALLVVEAMKMQNELRAPRAGTVTRIDAAAGSTVEVGDLLVTLG